jgi:hypothetical protein
MPNETKPENKSVQIKPQFEEMPRSSYVLSLASIADDIIPWGGNPHARDILLRSFWPTEPYLASAIYTIISRNVAFNWTLDGPPRTVKVIQDMLHNADLGRGWLSFITKLSIDLFTCDNGAFIEVIRGGLSETSPVIGIANLDSGRCRRTGVPDWPVVYTDRNGAEHKMLPWQVITVEEFPSPIETMNNVQMCAVSRILRMAQLMRDISVYKREKVSGHARAIDLVSGIRTQEIEDALKAHGEEQAAQGFIRFIKPMIFGTLDPNAKVAHERIDLSSLPDGFDEEVTMKWYISLLAMGFGADYQDFAPFPGGGLGSSQQSQILHQKSRGKGPALFMKTLEHKFNFHGVIPQNVTFRYDEQDTAGDMEQASLSKMRADTANVYVLNGVLTPEAVRQQMLDRGELTQEEFDKLQIEPDVTPDVVANDTEPLESKSRGSKFNENHDPDNGQFAAGEGGGGSSGGNDDYSDTSSLFGYNYSPSSKPIKSDEYKPTEQEEKWANNLPDKERQSIHSWQTGGTNYIRNYQITGKADETGEADEYYKKITANFESSLDKGIPYKGEVYRGLHDLNDDSYESVINSKEITLKSVASASISEERAKFFIQPIGDKPTKSVLFKIDNKTGVNISAVSNDSFKHEVEVVLRKNTRYEVASIEPTKFNYHDGVHNADKTIDGAIIHLKEK